MPIIVISCPKCHERHQLPPEASPIPPEGVRHQCAGCGTAFRVRPSAVARAAALSSPGPGGRTLEGMGPGPLGGMVAPAGLDALRPPPAAAPARGPSFELDPSIMSLLSPGVGTEDLPGLPSAVPVAAPGGENLPAPRAALREPAAAPPPSSFDDDDDVPMLDDDLLQPLESGLHTLPKAPEADAFTDLGLDLGGNDPFAAQTSIGASAADLGISMGGFDEPPTPRARPMPGASLDLGRPATAPLDLSAPEAAAPLDLGGFDLDLPAPSASLPTPSVPLPTPSVPLPAPRAAVPMMDLGLDLGLDGPSFGAAEAPSLGLDLDEEAEPTQMMARPPRAEDSGMFSLDFLTNGPAGAPPANHPAAAAPSDAIDIGLDLPPNAEAAPAAPLAAASVEGMQQLAPPRARIGRPRSVTPPPETIVALPPRRSKWRLVGALAAAGALGGGAVFWMTGGGGRDPHDVLGDMMADLARDDYPAYGRGVTALTAAKGDGEARALLDASAAELALRGALGHGGDKSQVTRAEQILSGLTGEGAETKAARRARALLAIAKGKPRDAEPLLAGQDGAEAAIVVALQRLGEGKADKAAETLQKATTDAPNELLLQYLLARARETLNPPGAAAAYTKVLGKNPKHAGSRIALLRLSSESPEKRLVAARALAAEVGKNASADEIAELQVVIGRAAAALGQSDEALEALQKAASLHTGSVTAGIALGEALVDAGRPAEALQRLRALGAPALRVPAGKLAMGGALIGTGKIEEGLALVSEAAKSAVLDPRGPYWMGVGAGLAATPELAAAEASYRQALMKNPRFLPAALRLAALLQRIGKPDDSVAVLGKAEAAGAPAAALQLAFGEALLAGGKPAEAAKVFREATGSNPKLPAAHTGLASALDASGQRDEALQVLEKAIVALPDGVGLHERHSDLLARAGKRDEALAALEAEIGSGKAPLRVRVKLANMAIDLGKLELADKQLELVVNEAPDAPGALFALGRLREAQGQLSLAIQQYRRALAFESSPELFLAVGRAYVRANKDDDAVAAFDQATGLAAAHLERGRIRLRKSDFERALTDFQEAARLEPTDATPLVLQGTCLDQMGQAERAASLWGKAVALAPKAGEAQYRLGRYKMDTGKAKDALTNLRAAALAVPEKAQWEADLYFQLGYAEITAGSRGSGAAALRKYLDIAPPDTAARPEVERQLARLQRR